MDQAIAQNVSGEWADLSRQLEALWKEKWLVFSAVILGGVICGGASFLIPKSYEASVLVMPLSESGEGAMGGGALMSQLGGLASLAGISVADGSKKAESVAVLQSEALTDAFIQERQLLPVLFEHEWDVGRKEWKHLEPGKQPTLWKANRLFKESVRQVSTNNKTGLVTVTIRWRDPKLAADWANDLVRMTNAYLKDKAIRESERNIAYLSSEAQKSNILEARQAIYSVLQTELNRSMLARGREEYALRVIDPAVVPEKPSFPEKVQWIAVGAGLGFVLSVIVTLFRVRSGLRRL